MAETNQRRVSFCMYLLYFFLIICLVIVLSGLTTGLTFFIFVPFYTMSNVDFELTSVSHTEMWSLIFSTNHNSIEFVPKDFDALGRSIDRLIQLDFPSTIVRSAFFTKRIEKSDMSIESKTIYLHLQIQLRYPSHCAKINQCEQLFRYRTLIKIIEQQSFQLPVLLTNDEQIHLDIQLEHFDDKSGANADYLKNFTTRQKDSVESNHRSCSENNRPPTESK